MDCHRETPRESSNFLPQTRAWHNLLDVSQCYDSIPILEEDVNYMSWDLPPISERSRANVSVPIVHHSLSGEDFCSVVTDLVRSCLNNAGVPEFYFPLKEDIVCSVARSMFLYSIYSVDFNVSLLFHY